MGNETENKLRDVSTAVLIIGGAGVLAFLLKLGGGFLKIGLLLLLLGAFMKFIYFLVTNL